MLLVQYGYIFLVLIFLLLFSSPESSENKETKISELGKYTSYCTLSRAITIKLRGHGNKSSRDCNKKFFCCNRMDMFHCVPTSDIAILQHFPLDVFVAETKKISNQFDIFFCCSNKIFMLQLRIIQKPSCPPHLEKIFCNIF